MDVREMADNYIRNVHDPLIDYEADIFIAGYNVACEWRNRSTCPQDGTKILITDDLGNINICLGENRL